MVISRRYWDERAVRECQVVLKFKYQYLERDGNSYERDEIPGGSPGTYHLWKGWYVPVFSADR
jgi:hypothetical protein